MFATPQEPGLASAAPATIGGTAITSPASASRISHCSPPHDKPEPRDFDLRGGLAREARRQLLLERAEVEFRGAGHGVGRLLGQPIAVIFASSSSRLTGFTM